MSNLMKVVLAGTELGNSNYSMVFPANFVKQIFNPPHSQVVRENIQATNVTFTYKNTVISTCYT